MEEEEDRACMRPCKDLGGKWTASQLR